MHAFLLLPLLGLLTACDNGKKNTAECADNGDCAEMQACIDGACVDVECMTSADCQLHQYCNTRDNRYVCVDGCLDDDDCYAGEQCNTVTRECEEYGCRTSTLDCPAGQNCNHNTGECETLYPDLCQRTCDATAMNDTCGRGQECTPVDYVQGCNSDRDCETGWHCDQFLTSDTFCTSARDCPEGSECTWLGQCVANYCHVDYCLPTCNPQATGADQCPAGFTCSDNGLGGGVCYGDCEYLTENGFL